MSFLKIVKKLIIYKILLNKKKINLSVNEKKKKNLNVNKMLIRILAKEIIILF